MYFRSFNIKMGIITRGFPLIVLTCSILALVEPALFTWFTGKLINIGLGIIMLGMGITLKPEDFKRILLTPGWVAAGFLLQFSVMPFLGWSLAKAFDLPDSLAAGLILVSCCPGGTASNVIAYLARANVALSVTMTACSTILAVFCTPLLTSWLAGSRVEVDAAGLFYSTALVVLLPVFAGTLLNKYLPAFTKKLTTFSPAIAVIFITLIVASIIGQGQKQILVAGFSLLGAVFFLHLFGFGLGYFTSKLLLKNEAVARTIAIEVGMQNSGLGAVLAREHFPDPSTAIPSALSSLTHCLLGSAFAWIAGRKATAEVHKEAEEELAEYI